ncbi:unnamed protein product [Medioppia subpectinata]|uniref:Origin recognition complex subunit 2 n=1 Tax=Medioppia subpectinata TaxID=1979941 RepID=A0A7R9KTZ5_9ACAR|nr:unnamed protein product [Medioppia subpectinata]CAG2109791.1 unnamed protein product [Medioppia subpectinata]
MSPKKSPKKRVKSVLVTNDDADVMKILDKSKPMIILTDCMKNNGLNGMNGKTTVDESSDSSDGDNEEESMTVVKNRVIDSNYFMAQSSRSKTSKNAFAKVIQNFDLNESKIKDIIENQFVDQRRHFIDLYINNNYFEEWFQSLNCGFNVLLYGLGSKRKLLDQFITQCLQSDHHIVINGYNNEMTVKNMINVLNEVMSESINDETKLIDKLKDIDFDVYLVIHSIDFLFGNNSKMKSLFSQMVSVCSRLRFIASVDHVNSGLLWSTTESNAYKWLWFNVPTYESYTIEKAFSTGLSMLSGSSKSWTQSLTYSSVKHVYDSLTTNAQKVFLLILTHFVEKDETNSGFAFSDCYSLCREEFLVTSELTYSRV